MSTQIGDYLKVLRGSLSLREAASRTNGKVSHSTIAQAEKGKNSHGKPFKPTPDTLVALSQVYNADYKKLLSLAGYLSPDFNKSESQEQQPINATEKIPVYGSIRAGIPNTAVENIIGSVWVPIDFQERYGRENLFALRINGESMNKEIPNGYVAVFAKSVTVDNGDIVAVLIDGEEATIKRFEQTSQAVIFTPESWDESFKPIIFHRTDEQDFKIMGKFLFATSAEI